MGSVCSHLWHWAVGEGEKPAAEAEQLIDLLVYAFYSALKLEFDVSVWGIVICLFGFSASLKKS